MIALVTGANGFIGSHLVEELLSRNIAVRCLVRKTSNLQWIKSLQVDLVFGNIMDENSLNVAVHDVDYVYHLSGVLRARHERDFYQINQHGTKKLLAACAHMSPNLKRFIYISSQAAAGPGKTQEPLTEDSVPQPISFYGKSKLMGEKEVQSFGNRLDYTIIRPPSVYGPRDDDILMLFKIIRKGVKPIIGVDEKRLSIVYIKDLVRGIIDASLHLKGINEIFNITNMENYSWLELENFIEKIVGKKGWKINIPEFLLNYIAWCSENIAKSFGNAAVLNNDKALEMRQNYWLLDGKKAKEKFGFETQVQIEDGLKETYEWYQQNNWL